MINLNSAFEDELYFMYLKDPDSVSKEWRDYFEKVHGKSVFVLDNGFAKPASDTMNETHHSSVSKPYSQFKYNLKNDDFTEPIGSYQAQIAGIIQESLSVPTATSFRTIPVKALDENKRIINRYHHKLKKQKISFTHILAWSVVRALKKFPFLNDTITFENGIPYKVKRKSLNIGLAVDVNRADGTRLMMVPCIKNAQNLSFIEFVKEFELLIEKARTDSIKYEELMDATISLTNPGMIGTSASIPRLFNGQSMVIASGSIDYPPEFQAVRPETLSTFAISKVVQLTNTYDHRIIQGAESAEFLNYINRLLLGYDQFYEQIFYSLNIPFEPVKWAKDISGKLSPFHTEDDIEKGAHVMLMINAYRVRGHLLANINPLGFENYYYPELDPAYYGFTIWDLDRVFHADDSWNNNNPTLREIIEILRETYCGSIGIEFMHIQNPEKKDWIKSKLELSRSTVDYSKDEKLRIFKKLAEAEQFENFLHTKFVGSKRFSLEGGEAFIVLLDRILEQAAENHLHTVIVGMAHRGRLNVLAHSVGKSYIKMFKEFEGEIDPESFQGSGDVKYHLGEQGVYNNFNNNKVNIKLAPNPSHLELVNPVVEGMARALENEIHDKSYSKVIPVLVHGDAAFSGQGIVAETLNLSQLDGYKTGGTIHVVINNQIGFTTTIESSRSTVYATDIAKMIQTPIIHVNGNDPEAVRTAASLAADYRAAFKCDVIIDMLCYRKYGHNESDEPTYTQPLLYKKIKSLENVSRLYEKELLNDGLVNIDEIQKIRNEIKTKLDEAFSRRKDKIQQTQILIQPHKAEKIFDDHHTSVNIEMLSEITKAMTTLPSNFIPNTKISQLLKKRLEMMQSFKPMIDWGMAESLAFGSLLIEGKEIRFTGQDSQRGTFSHRHAVLTDMETEADYTPLNNIRKGQAPLRIFDSPLSEMAVLGFEYGYSVISKDGLTLWEAQFGDFANGAQPIFDQFISCAEVKWGQTSNLVVLLPHGYDGQGPEHSSARMERYLQLAAEENMIIANFTMPANYFHALRRQTLMPFRIPMIVMTPKGTLRHPLAVSSVDDLTDGKFHTIIDDDIENKSNIERVLICSGKVYFDLFTEKQKKAIDNIAILRLEQIYPFDSNLLNSLLGNYNNLKEVFWVQEEPKNMGAASFVTPLITEILNSNVKFRYVGRKASASTATGFAKIHVEEQNKIIHQALTFD